MICISFTHIDDVAASRCLHMLADALEGPKLLLREAAALPGAGCGLPQILKSHFLFFCGAHTDPEASGGIVAKHRSSLPRCGSIADTHLHRASLPREARAD